MMQLLNTCINLTIEHITDMRTTVILDDEIAAIAVQYAESRGLSLSEAIAELIVRGTRQTPRIK